MKQITGDTPMNVPRNTLNRPYSGSAYSKLALMAGVSLALMAAIGKQLPASAADKSTVVLIADLDLSTEKGMETARERVHEAARKLCNKVVDPWSLSHQPDYVQCVDDATVNAVTQLQAAVTQLRAEQLVANANTNGPGRSNP
jgi:UrcA family protein